MSIKAPVRFGLIGCGTIADVHRRALADIPDARIVAVASRDGEKARAFAEKAGCHHTVGHAALLASSDIDAVIITTSSGSHAAICRDALEAGKHVVVEKPMAMTGPEAQAVANLAAQKGLQLSVIFQRRFEPHHQAVKKAIDSGALGRLLLCEVACPYYRDQAYYDSAGWRGTLAEDGGALMNQAIHSVDLLLWLAGPATRVFAETATQTHRMEAEDLALALIRLQRGGYATLMASTSIRPGYTASLNLYGELGSIKLAGSEVVAWNVPNVPAPTLPSTSAVGVATHLLASHDAHRAQLADFVAALVEGRTPLVSATEGVSSVALIEAVYRSSANSSPVAL
jgi:UDP-N-acetyl-2-amino-2-deoxyglucuronate dehydrogenase